MKSLRILSLLVLLSLAIVAVPLASANNSGPSSNGDFSFTLEDGASRLVQFNAKVNSDGSTKGELTYNDPTDIPESEESGFALTGGFYVKANIDCLVVRGNKAVMSGQVTDASVAGYVGNRILLAVEDNGEGVKAPDRDKLAWGVYRLMNRNWIPQDAEIPGDDGALLNWLATDFERTEDVPVPGRPSESIGCQSFSLSSYSFEQVKHGSGNIQVKP